MQGIQTPTLSELKCLNACECIDRPRVTAELLVNSLPQVPLSLIPPFQVQALQISQFQISLSRIALFISFAISIQKRRNSSSLVSPHVASRKIPSVYSKGSNSVPLATLIQHGSKCTPVNTGDISAKTKRAYPPNTALAFIIV